MLTGIKLDRKFTAAASGSITNSGVGGDGSSLLVCDGPAG